MAQRRALRAERAEETLQERGAPPGRADEAVGELREHVEVLAAEAERLEGVAERARRDAVVAKRRLEGERDAAAAGAAETALVRQQVARRLDAVQATIADLRGELEDRVVAERGRAAAALARERELWEAAVEAERRRADS